MVQKCAQAIGYSTTLPLHRGYNHANTRQSRQGKRIYSARFHPPSQLSDEPRTQFAPNARRSMHGHPLLNFGDIGYEKADYPGVDASDLPGVSSRPRAFRGESSLLSISTIPGLSIQRHEHCSSFYYMCFRGYNGFLYFSLTDYGKKYRMLFIGLIVGWGISSGSHAL